MCGPVQELIQGFPSTFRPWDSPDKGTDLNWAEGIGSTKLADTDS